MSFYHHIPRPHRSVIAFLLTSAASLLTEWWKKNHLIICPWIFSRAEAATRPPTSTILYECDHFCYWALIEKGYGKMRVYYSNICNGCEWTSLLSDDVHFYAKTLFSFISLSLLAIISRKILEMFAIEHMLRGRYGVLSIV